MIPLGPKVYTLNVTLREVSPAVRRRIIVRSDAAAKFARVLEVAMGSEGSHLHMFDVGGVPFGEPEEDSDYVIDERYATERHLLPGAVEAEVDYDFGDGWVTT